MPFKDYVRTICPVIKYATCIAALIFLMCAVSLFVREYESDGDNTHAAAHMSGILVYLFLIASDQPIFVSWSLLHWIQILIDLLVVRFVGEDEDNRARFKSATYHVYQMVLGVVSSMFSTILDQHTSSNSQHVLINGLTSVGILLFSLSLSCDDYGGSNFFTSYILSYIVTTTNIPYLQMTMYACIPSSKYVIVPLCEFILNWVREENEKEMAILAIIQKPTKLLEDIDQQSLRDLKFRLDCATIALNRTGNDLKEAEANHKESIDKLTKDHKTEYDKLGADFEAEQKKVEKLEDELKKSEKKLRDDLKKAKANHEESIEKLTKDHKTEYDKLGADFEAEQEKVEKLEDELKKSEKKLRDDLKKAKANHEESIEKLTKDHKTEYDKLGADFEAEQEKVNKLKGEHETSEKKLRDDLKKAEANHAESIEMLTKDHKTKYDNLRADFEAEQEKVKNLKGEHEKSEMKLRGDLKAEQVKVQEYRKLKETAQKEVTDLNQVISGLKNKCKKLENDKNNVIENHKSKNDELNRALKAEQGKVTNLRRQISDSEKEKKDLEEEKTRLIEGHETKTEKLNEDHKDEKAILKFPTQLKFASPNSYEASDIPDIDWDSLGFGFTSTDYMFVMNCSDGENFVGGELKKFGNIELSPSSAILNYDQGLFEGLKAYWEKDGNIMLFRPKENAARLRIGAERMCMPAPTEDQFVGAVKATVLANKRWIPPLGKGSLYIRSLLMGSGVVLGVAPAPEYTFLIYVSPVGNYFKEQACDTGSKHLRGNVQDQGANNLKDDWRSKSI